MMLAGVHNFANRYDSETFHEKPRFEPSEQGPQLFDQLKHRSVWKNGCAKSVMTGKPLIVGVRVTAPTNSNNEKRLIGIFCEPRRWRWPVHYRSNQQGGKPGMHLRALSNPIHKRLGGTYPSVKKGHSTY